MKKIVLLLLVMAPCLVFSQGKQEITTTDITKTAKIDGNKISVYGLYLGMSRAETKKILEANTSLKAETDAFNTKSEDENSTEELRYYVYNAYTDDAGKKELLYVIFDEGAKGITSIVLFSDMKDNVTGGAKQFFTKNSMDPASSFYKKYLGKPTKSKKGSYGLNTNFYQTKSISTISYTSSGKTDYYFKLCKKAD